MSVSIPGYYTVNVAKNLKERLEGQAYMNLHVDFNETANPNCNIVVSTNEDVSEDDLRAMVIYKLVTLASMGV